MYSKNFYFTSIFILIFTVINIALNYWLIDLYKINGAAYATTIATILYITTQVVFVYFKFRITPYQIKQLYIIVFALLIWAITLLLPQAQNFWEALVLLVCKAAIITVLYFTLILRFHISPELNDLYKMGLNLIRKKLGK